MSESSAARAARGADKAAADGREAHLSSRSSSTSSRPGPDSRDQLIESLADAEHKELIEPESRMMLEGVIRMADMTAGDVMVRDAAHGPARHRRAATTSCCTSSSDTGHSRFPVFEERRDNVIGILMAKDLLKLQRSPDLNLRTLLRPAVFVPESKALNELLRDFRTNRNHLAIVIDEFGNTAGLLTIEDVLEEIVGEIEDEFDDEGRRVEHLHARRRQPAGRRRRRRWRRSTRPSTSPCRPTSSTPSAASSRTSSAGCRGAASR